MSFEGIGRADEASVGYAEQGALGDVDVQFGQIVGLQIDSDCWGCGVEPAEVCPKVVPAEAVRHTRAI